MSHRLDGYLPPQTAATTDGYSTLVSSQSATGTNSAGGDINIKTGTGTSHDGYIYLYTGNTARLYVTTGFVAVATPLFDFITPLITIDGYQINPSVFQLAQPISGTDGYDLTVGAQSSTNSPAHGGNLVLKGGDGYDGDGYFRDGYVKLYSGANEQARAVPNRFYMLTGQRVNTAIITSSPFNVPDGYYVMLVDTSSAITINLPANPLGGDIYKVKDSTGNAGGNSITISGNGRNIDSTGSYTISSNYGFATFVYNVFNNIWNTI